MNGSFQLGTAFGIPIRMHWTFPLVLLLFVSRPNPALGLLFGLTLFGCVLLHELGHSLVARSFGIRVMDITFWPLGGMARMTRMPEDARKEALIALAGPAVNFVLAGAGLLLVPFLPEVGMAFVGINLMLGVFNLLPAFPMDGGRVLRSFFARKLDWVAATERAVGVGRFLAGAMVVLSVFLMAYAPQAVCALPLIAVFVWVSGGQELAMVRIRHGLPPFGSSLFQSFADAAGAARPPRPTWSTPTGSAEEPDPDEPEVEPPAARGARRPRNWDTEPRASGRGFDEEAVRELERYRGRLRRPEAD